MYPTCTRRQREALKKTKKKCIIARKSKNIERERERKLKREIIVIDERKIVPNTKNSKSKSEDQMAGKDDQREEALNASTEDEDVQTFISSRLCIKNLPKHYTEARFREHFSSIGEVTDCVIKNTHHGGTDENDKNRSSWQHRKQRRQTSRCLGFIGYKTEQMALSLIHI